MKYIVLLFLFLCVNISFSPCLADKGREVRAVWLTVLGGLDWPHSYAHDGLGIEMQKRELCALLDKYVEAGLNTVLMQTRVRGTMIYPSAYEPWTVCLSGKEGESPGYDALAFAIEECHKRGLKVHAWVVAIPLGKWNSAGCVNLRKKQPSLLKRIGEEGYMNPESAGTASYIASVCKEITQKYDIDGIHLDYIRYPETWKNIRNKQQARENITRIVRAIHREVKNEKPWVVISCSPVGKYADTKRSNARGWNARDAVCQDAALWLKEGLMDALFPMMYFKDEHFYPFLIDWYERSEGKIIVPGLGIYFMHPREKNWSLTDVTREMNVSHSLGMGYCFFRSQFFTDNVKGIFDYTKDHYSQHITQCPALTWESNTKPPSPTNLRIMTMAGTEDNYLVWDIPTSDKQLLYNVYGEKKYIETDEATEDNSELLVANITGTAIQLPKSQYARTIDYKVCSVDRYGNESEPCITGKENWQRKSSFSKKKVEKFFLPVKGGYVYLEGVDVSPSELVVIRSLAGTDVSSRIVSTREGRVVIDVSAMPRSYYSLYLLKKRGKEVLLGRISTF